MGVYKIIYDKESNKIYEGECEGQIREGRGSLYYSSGVIKYLGEWKNDSPDGIGVLFYENGVKFYEGKWVAGSACGQGVLFTENGRREYEGHFEESKKSGVGIIYYDDGASYQGEWKADRRDGFGSLFYSTGELQYRGIWLNSEKSGNGMLLTKDESLIYQGEFLNDMKNGLGRSYYPSGKVEYDGQWSKDEKSGEGILYGENGEKSFQGFFENGKIIETKIIKNETHNEIKVEHTKEESLEEIGIDISIFNKEGNSIIDEDDGARFKFLNENNNEITNDEFNIEKTDFVYNQFREGYFGEDNEAIEFEIIDKQETRSTVDDLEDLDVKESAEADEVIDEKTVNFVMKEEFEEEVYDEKEDGEIEDEIININEEIELDVEVELEVDVDTQVQEIDAEEIEVIANENVNIVASREAENIQMPESEIKNKEVEEKEKEDEATVEVRIENNKVYKYIEIGDYIYKGEFNEGDRTGISRVYYKNLLKYDGFIKGGIYDGIGKLYDINEKLEYEGLFEGGKRHGNGISYDSFGNVIYKGNWKYDLQDGDGELLNSNGDKIYKGTFYKGKALGLGVAIESEIDSILYCELESMVGLEEVKDEVARLVSFLKMQILRQRVSYKIMDIPYVFTFEGNIGVGKEEVARILGKLYYILGLIPEYNFVQRDLLTALEYSHDGDIEKSMDNFGGGVLYLSNLYQNNYDDINEVIKNKVSTENVLDLVDYSNGHFIIVFSGDEELIETMIHNKKELAKCVGKSIIFFDYTVDEMMDYILSLSIEKDYIFSEELVNKLETFFTEVLENEKYNNRNSEFIKEIFTELVKEQCIRIDTYGVTDIENLKKLEIQDFKNIENKICF